ncbi:mechanosensitive ion channel [Candidatus Peregrinibacteria bacterium]|nr:mechanosensitive ion channel [Candidatus Peregrinibacteria bacterium]
MDTLNQLLSYQINGNTVKDIFIALAIFVGTLIVIKIFKAIILKRLNFLCDKTKNDFDDFLIKIIKKINWFFYFIVAFYFAVQPLSFSNDIRLVIKAVFLVVVIYQAIQSLGLFIEYWLAKFSSKQDSKEETARATFMGVNIIVKILLWLVGIILILSNLGVNITSLVASLGIGGIAVALAAQNILGDVFSSFIIYFDKPFEIGDYVVLGTDDGIVERIGLKTTRIRTLQGEELVISNQELTSSRIHNYKKMQRRRIVFNFGVVYEISNEKLKKIPSIIKDIINEIELAQLDRVHFKEFGESALNFEVAYFIDSPEYSVNLDKRQELNLKLKDVFEKEGIDFAYPTQTVYEYRR